MTLPQHLSMNPNDNFQGYLASSGLGSVWPKQFPPSQQVRPMPAKKEVPITVNVTYWSQPHAALIIVDKQGAVRLQYLTQWIRARNHMEDQITFLDGSVRTIRRACHRNHFVDAVLIVPEGTGVNAKNPEDV